MMAQNTNAMIQIANDNMVDCKEVFPFGDKDVDIYLYPYNITELELVDEIEHLSEFYAELALPIWYPPHIRESVIVGALCNQGSQCTIFCKYFKKGGCTKYVAN